MITNPLELAVQRQTTAAFIDANYEFITLIPVVKTKSSTGGLTDVEGTPRPPQKFHVGESGRVVAEAKTSQGVQHEQEFFLVGNWDATIGTHDIFDLLGARWQVVQVEWNNGYETRAVVRRYGR